MYNEKFTERIFKLLCVFDCKTFSKESMISDMNSDLYLKACQMCEVMGINYLLSKCVIYDTLKENGEYEELIIRETTKKLGGVPIKNVTEIDYMNFLLKQRLYIVKKFDKKSIQRVLDLTELFSKNDFNIDSITF